MTPYHSQFWANLLTLKGAGGSIENLTRSISNARVDLNPHQVDAALFALRSPLSKGAILADEGITKTTALELAGRGIRVNAVAPGAIATDMIDRFAGEEGSDNRKWLASQHPMGRLGLPKEIAAAVLYLASDEASFTTGISLPVDGEYLAK